MHREKQAADARRKATRDKWDEDTASIKNVCCWLRRNPFSLKTKSLPLTTWRLTCLKRGRVSFVQLLKRILWLRCGTARSQTSLDWLVFSVSVSAFCKFVFYLTISHNFSPTREIYNFFPINNFRWWTLLYAQNRIFLEMVWVSIATIVDKI